MLRMAKPPEDQQRGEEAAVRKAKLAGRLGVLGGLLSSTAMTLMLFQILPWLSLGAIVVGIGLSLGGVVIARPLMKKYGPRTLTSYNEPGRPSRLLRRSRRSDYLSRTHLRVPLLGAIYGVLSLVLGIALGLNGPPIAPDGPDAAEPPGPIAGAAGPRGGGETMAHGDETIEGAELRYRLVRATHLMSASGRPQLILVFALTNKTRGRLVDFARMFHISKLMITDNQHKYTDEQYPREDSDRFCKTSDPVWPVDDDKVPHLEMNETTYYYVKIPALMAGADFLEIDFAAEYQRKKTRAWLDEWTLRLTIEDIDEQRPVRSPEVPPKPGDNGPAGP